MEGTDACLAGSLIVEVVDGSGQSAVDVGDGLERLVGDGQVAHGTDGVEDNIRMSFVRGGTTQETKEEACAGRRAMG